MRLWVRLTLFFFPPSSLWCRCYDYKTWRPSLIPNILGQVPAALRDVQRQSRGRSSWRWWDGGAVVRQPQWHAVQHQRSGAVYIFLSAAVRSWHFVQPMAIEEVKRNEADVAHQQDNDRYIRGSCAQENKAGWWFNRWDPSQKGRALAQIHVSCLCLLCMYVCIKLIYIWYHIYFDDIICIELTHCLFLPGVMLQI